MKKKVFSLVLVAVFMFTSCAKDDSSTSTVYDGAYVLSDKATFLNFSSGTDGNQIPNLKILFEKDSSMLNTYAMIAVDPNGAGFQTEPELNTEGADSFIKWMSLESTRELIANFGIDTFGEALFYLDPKAQMYTGDADALKKPEGSDAVVSVSTTTSVNDSGLFSVLEPAYEAATGYDIQITSKGTGAAIQDARDGNADLLFVHSKKAEEAFIDGNYARTVESLAGVIYDDAYSQRIPFINNYFVLIGPETDPAGVAEATTVKDAFKLISDGKYNFISRGDISGTHNKEATLWQTELGITTTVENLPDSINGWYTSAGKGMGDCLLMASNTDSSSTDADTDTDTDADTDADTDKDSK